MTRLDEHASISCAFRVERTLEVTAAGFVERAVDPPWTKDYDALPGNHPRDWAKLFPVPGWRLLAARLDGRRVGGAVLALDPARAHAVLYDLRVAAEARGRGVGAELLRAAEALAAASHFAELEIETQNVNVPACRLYLRKGYALAAVDPDGVPKLPGETALLWRKSLRPR